MTDRQIECFLSAACTLNFAKTAKELHCTPQVVSKLIASLEAELELTLFDRSKNSKHKELTPAGEYCRRYLARSQRQKEQIMREVVGYYWSLAKSLCLGISEVINPFQDELSQVLCSFQQGNSGMFLSAECNSDEYLLEKLEDGSLDAVIMSTANLTIGKEFEWVPLARSNMMLVVPERVCGAEWAGAPDRDCWHVPILLNSSKARGRLENEQTALKEFHELGIYPPAIILATNAASVSASLMTTHCVTIADTRFGYVSDKSRLRYFPLKGYKGEETNIICAWSSSAENPMIWKFIRFAQKSFGDFSPEDFREITLQRFDVLLPDD